MSKQDFADTFDAFEVHVVLSKGKFAFAFDKVEKSDTGYAVTISNEELELNYVEVYTGELTEEEAAKVPAFFEEEGVTDLPGNVFCTKEKHADAAFRELRLCISDGLDREGPTKEQFTDILAQSLISCTAPDFSKASDYEVYHFLLSLFDLSVFENDPIAAAFVEKLKGRVKALTADVTVAEIPATDALPSGAANAVRDIRLKATGPAGSSLLQLTPASNGCFFAKL
eukprot:CAMPEP_0114632882 /NCGR_PEP_ID=MMETSP0168-20121206/15161_1 /TAXON_ID=95228 ORGANISM="Vannella sp., Strain DIVA3 517/6/12" /NCGR_SAMPLE_ID=MMETSP0168 /ASSEMBLY_ACC=CAM_ASM_000044 /LENGTH=226 /DNA_ID=CAMNT_0001844501 /DNA_START=24 /DNA_END=704 /DNA_ORIENTATION=-